ncbi:MULTISPECIES: LysR family transcriptional regulator substrate-binding protein [unclassified Corynebacterium]|uniref:LysR family transcriptional regulator substrate-binding protein n=1 Tax=unclassified Corynebacterium TaxID=2624378 RepID=UPI001787A618|nr:MULTISPECIES: LysR family transcriptional regulator substrate-binding protein [unclassified Corynebacterium]
MPSAPQPASSPQQSRTPQPVRGQRCTPSRSATEYLKVVFSPGVVPDKWFSRFDERTRGWCAAGAQVDDPMKYIRSGAADIALVRLSAAQQDAGEDYHHVRLYDEQLGVAAPKEHPIKVMDSVTHAELSDEIILYHTPLDGRVDIDAVREALGVVGANVGVCIAPRPLLRAVNQPRVVHRDLLQPTGIGGTRVAVVWAKERDDEVVQDFVGICRGRGAGSSRQALTKARVRRGSANTGSAQSAAKRRKKKQRG